MSYPIIPAGNGAMNLTNGLDFNGGLNASVLTGSADPTVTPTSANPGTLYLNTAGNVFKKNDSGSTTNWTNLTGALSTGIPRMLVTLSASQTIPAGTATTANFDTIDVSFSNNTSWFNITTHAFTPQIAGVYIVNTSAFLSGTNNRSYVAILKNGVAIAQGDSGGASGDMGMDTTFAVSMNGSTDSLTVQVFSFSSVSTTLTPGTSTFFQIIYLANLSTGGGSGINRTVQSISSPTTAGATANTDYVYLVSGTTTLTLPTAVGNTNKYTVTNTGVNTVTVATTSSQTINGSSTATLPIANMSLDFISDGANWHVE
jgi:hypothetical protein